jgi:hypothetical protein
MGLATALSATGFIGGMWLGEQNIATPVYQRAALLGNASSTTLNAPTGGTVNISIGASPVISFAGAGLTFQTNSIALSGSTVSLSSAQYFNTLIQLTGNITANIQLQFPNLSGNWSVDTTLLTFNPGASLTFTSGSGLSTPVYGPNGVIEVYTYGNNAISISPGVTKPYSAIQLGVTGPTGFFISSNSSGPMAWAPIISGVGNIQQATVGYTGSTSINIYNTGQYQVNYSLQATGATGPLPIIWSISQRLNPIGTFAPAANVGTLIAQSVAYMGKIGYSGVWATNTGIASGISGGTVQIIQPQVSNDYIVAIPSGYALQTFVQGSTGIQLSATGSYLSVHQLN